MNKLPKIKGLLCAAAELRRAAERNEATAASSRKDPRIAHEAGVSAEQERKRAADMEENAADLMNSIERIEAEIAELAASKFQSASRMLALRDLENASMRLRRAIGDEPSKR